MSKEMRMLLITLICTAALGSLGDLYLRVSDLEDIAISGNLIEYRVDKLESKVFKN